MRLITAAAALLATAIVVGFLYFGRDVLIPLALTTLISFALGPLVSWLRHFVGMRLAVALSVLLAVLIVGGITFLLAWQITDLAANLPKYRSNLLQKIDEFRAGCLVEGVERRAFEGGHWLGVGLHGRLRGL